MAHPEPESLPAALFRHAALRPEEPWLFVREGWDWRWSSFAEVADRVDLWAATISSSFPPFTRLAFPDLPLPRAVALDLAIQTAGATSVPIPSSLATSDLSPTLIRLGIDAWLGAGSFAPEIRAFHLPEPAIDGGRRAGPSGEDGAQVSEAAGRVPEHRPQPDGPAWRPGHVLVLEPGAPRELSQADLLSAASAIQAALPGAGGREIAVLAPPLAADPARRFLAWATVAGAALLLEPEPAALAATAAWARPTVFLGDAGAIAALRRALPAEGRLARLRRPRLPFGRLHTLFLAGPADPAGTGGVDAAFWMARGGRLLPLP